MRLAKYEKLPLQNSKQLDFAVGEYLNMLFWEGESVAAGGHLLSGLKRFYPQWRLSLPTASQYFRNWQKIHKPQRAIPISWTLLQAMGALCLELGFPSVALMLYVGFLCFLRTSEMLSLQMFHILLHDRQPLVTIIIPFAKTSNGNPQVVQVKDPFLHLLSKHMQRQVGRKEFLYPGSQVSLRKFWRKMLQCLHFDPSDYSPYGIRRGGATHFFLQTGSLDATLQRGRWVVPRVAKQYLDDGTLAIASLQWSRQQRRTVRKWALKGARNLQRLRQKTQQFGIMGVVV